MDEQHEAYRTAHGIYDNANFALRFALFIAVAWPLALVAIAMFAAPAKAQTIVPIVALTPIAAAVCYAISGAPFLLLSAALAPEGRKFLRYLAAFIGIELVIGVYFALVPISNDLGLVPLLILTACAAVFLRLGGIGKGIAAVMVALAIIVTAVFLFGGRGHTTSTLKSVLQIQDPVVTQHCVETSDAFHCETLPSEKFSFTLDLTPSFSKPLYFPSDCRTWTVKHHGYGWYGYRDPSNGAAYGPFSPDGKEPTISLHNAVAVQGQNGTSVTINCSPAAPEPATVAQAPGTVQDTPKPVTAEAGGFVITMNGCNGVEHEITCSGSVVNRSQTTLLFRFNTDLAPLTYMIDNFGNQYVDASIGFDSGNGPGGIPLDQEQLAPNFPQNFSIRFINDNLSTAVTSLSVALRCFASSPQAYTQWGFVVFRDIKIQPGQAPPVAPVPPAQAAESSGIPPASAPTPIRVDWDQAKTVYAGQYIIAFPPCVLRAAILKCFFRITNTGNEMKIEMGWDGWHYKSRAIDENGTEFIPKVMTLGANESSDGNLWGRLPSGAPFLGSATFELSTIPTRLSVLELRAYEDFPRNSLDFLVRDVSIEAQ